MSFSRLKIILGSPDFINTLFINKEFNNPTCCTLYRYLVAGKDLAAGELIIEEDPLVIGPSQQCGLVCLGCYCPIQIDTIVR
jgi:hypothetical protein